MASILSRLPYPFSTALPITARRRAFSSQALQALDALQTQLPQILQRNYQIETSSISPELGSPDSLKVTATDGKNYIVKYQAPGDNNFFQTNFKFAGIVADHFLKFGLPFQQYTLNTSNNFDLTTDLGTILVRPKIKRPETPEYASFETDRARIAAITAAKLTRFNTPSLEKTGFGMTKPVATALSNIFGFKPNSSAQEITESVNRCSSRYEEQMPNSKSASRLAENAKNTKGLIEILSILERQKTIPTAITSKSIIIPIGPDNTFNQMSANGSLAVTAIFGAECAALGDPVDALGLAIALNCFTKTGFLRDDILIMLGSWYKHLPLAAVGFNDFVEIEERISNAVELGIITRFAMDCQSLMQGKSLNTSSKTDDVTQCLEMLNSFRMFKKDYILQDYLAETINCIHKPETEDYRLVMIANLEDWFQKNRIDEEYNSQVTIKFYELIDRTRKVVLGLPDSDENLQDFIETLKDDKKLPWLFKDIIKSCEKIIKTTGPQPCLDDF